MGRKRKIAKRIAEIEAIIERSNDPDSETFWIHAGTGCTAELQCERCGNEVLGAYALRTATDFDARLAAGEFRCEKCKGKLQRLSDGNGSAAAAEVSTSLIEVISR